MPLRAGSRANGSRLVNGSRLGGLLARSAPAPATIQATQRQQTIRYGYQRRCGRRTNVQPDIDVDVDVVVDVDVTTL